MKDFNSLNEKEILALAISLEEEDERTYADYVDGLSADFPASAAVFEGMRVEESGHRRRLIELFRDNFGEHIPLIRRQVVKGFVARQPVWLAQPLNFDKLRKEAAAIEIETRRFYETTAAAVHPANRSAGIGWLDGRLGLDARAGVCRGIRHPGQLGGVGHTLPFLLPNFRLAMGIAVAVVLAELLAISMLRHRYMGTPAFSAALQVVIGGLLVLATGVLIGSA